MVVYLCMYIFINKNILYFFFSSETLKLPLSRNMTFLKPTTTIDYIISITIVRVDVYWLYLVTKM